MNWIWNILLVVEMLVIGSMIALAIFMSPWWIAGAVPLVPFATVAALRSIGEWEMAGNRRHRRAWSDSVERFTDRNP